MTDNKYNPIMETYFDENGKPITLEKAVKWEAENLALDYFHKYGIAPPQYMIINWMKRLKRAYHKCEIVTMQTV